MNELSRRDLIAKLLYFSKHFEIRSSLGQTLGIYTARKYYEEIMEIWELKVCPQLGYGVGIRSCFNSPQKK